jgi:predicted nucleotidyltransferase
MRKSDIILQVKQALFHLNVDKAILFGSYAKGEAKTGSDIDLLVVTDDNFIPQSFAQKMEMKLKISAALEKLREHADIDLIVHTKPMHEKFLRTNSGFKNEILNTGMVIYERIN